jgi:uncharacterized membrane protein
MQQTTPRLDRGPSGGLERHFTLPTIRQVPIGRPFTWLRLGWQDLRSNMPLSISYGLVFALAGWSILLFTAPRPYLFTASISGFMLIAPLLAAGLYEISRRHGQGLETHFPQSLEGWSYNGASIALFGLLLALIAIAWERVSAILFALLYGEGAPDLQSFVSEVFLSGAHWSFVIAYVVVGGVLAAIVFAMSAISAPMLVDRGVDVFTAVATSLRAVRRNLPAMALWAALIAILTAIGFATALIGLIVLLPWIAHATWHAYRDLAQP